MSVTSIIVNYHTSAFLSGLLDDLVLHPEMEKIFIVDNSGELDDSFISLKSTTGCRKRASIEILRPGKNLGFAAGVNLAAEKTLSEFILLINPDVRLLPGCVNSLLAASRKYDAVLTGPRFFWDDEKKFKLPPSQGTSAWLDSALYVSGFSDLDSQHLSFYWEMRHERFWEKKEPFVEFFLSGACALINRAWAYRNCNAVFDDRFFLYFEDNDISFRAFKDGSPPLCVPDAEAIHYYNQAAEPDDGKAVLMKNSHREYTDKYYPHVECLLHISSGQPKCDVSDILCNQDAGHTPLPEHDSLFPIDIEDLGGHTQVPGFDLDHMKSCGRLYFEIGVHRTFVPFVQTEIAGRLTRKSSEYYFLPDKIWQRLARGAYYSRVRDSIRGTLKIWKWQKK